MTPSARRLLPAEEDGAVGALAELADGFVVVHFIMGIRSGCRNADFTSPCTLLRRLAKPITGR